MVAIQYQVIYTNNYKNYVLNNPQITTHTCSQCRQKLETIQHTSSACHALAPGDYTHHHNQVASIVHQELAIKRTINAVL
jgi:arylamine N-acetyltransferase